MRKKQLFTSVWIWVLLIGFLTGCGKAFLAGQPNGKTSPVYRIADFILERNGLALHLQEINVSGSEPENNILLIHGVTYSSHEFDIDYEDYSLARKLAR